MNPVFKALAERYPVLADTMNVIQVSQRLT